jgi:hypothetical protein
MDKFCRCFEEEEKRLKDIESRNSFEEEPWKVDDDKGT